MIRHSDKTTSTDKDMPSNSTLSNTASQNESNANHSLSESNNANNQINATSAYTLYLEHLGGFLPILKGKRVSKIRPEFIIYDPQLPGSFFFSKTFGFRFCQGVLGKISL